MSPGTEHQGVFRASDVMREAGVTRRTVRFYEAQGLLVPAGRDRFGRRIYVTSDLLRMKLIRLLRSAGLSITAIRDVLDSRAVQPGDEQEGKWLQRMEEVLRAYSEKLRQHQQQVAQVDQEVTAAAAWIAAHRDRILHEVEQVLNDPQVPFLLRVLLVQPSTLQSGPPGRPPAGADALDEDHQLELGLSGW
jgi:DNA-binding transcriptional MerR regulator